MRKLLFIVMSALMFTSCVTEKKARNYYRVHPDKLAEICSDTYPPKIEYRPGKPVHTTDTAVIEVRDTVQADCPDGTKVDCPPNKVITKTIRDSVTVRDTLEVTSTQALATIDKMGNQIAALQGKYDKVIEERDSLKESNKEKNKWNWILGVSLVGLVGYRVFRILKVV